MRFFNRMATHTTTRTIAIQARVHRDTGLIAAFSDDLPGLLVTGRSEDEINEKLPAAIREILEAQGNVVAEVTAERDGDDAPREFRPPAFIANAVLTAAA